VQFFTPHSVVHISTTNKKWPTGIKWSRDRRHHVTPKGQTRDPNTLRTAGDAI